MRVFACMCVRVFTCMCVHVCERVRAEYIAGEAVGVGVCVCGLGTHCNIREV